MVPDDVVIALRVKDEDVRSWMDYHSQFCRGFIVLDDRSTSLKLGNNVLLSITKQSHLGFNELLDRELLLTACEYITPKYVLNLDADEYLDESFLDEMKDIDDNVGMIFFKNLFMIDDERYITDGIYVPKYKALMHRYFRQQTYLSQTADQSFFEPARIPYRHKSSIWFDWSFEWKFYYAKSIIKHYNMTSERKAKRFDFYSQLMPANNFEHINKEYSTLDSLGLHTTDDLHDERINFVGDNKVVCSNKNDLVLLNVGINNTGGQLLESMAVHLNFQPIYMPHKLFGSEWYFSNPPWSVLDKYTFLGGAPWFQLYKELDNRFKNKKIILTIRDENDWFGSLVDDFANNVHSLNKKYIQQTKKYMQMFFGAEIKNSNKYIFIEKYRKHNYNVQNYFSGRGDFMVLDVYSGDGFALLSNFVKN